jgi:hypothetical protein
MTASQAGRPTFAAKRHRHALGNTCLYVFNHLHGRRLLIFLKTAKQSEVDCESGLRSTHIGCAPGSLPAETAQCRRFPALNTADYDRKNDLAKSSQRRANWRLRC